MIELLPYILKAILGGTKKETITPGHTMAHIEGVSLRDNLLAQGYTFAQTKPLLSKEALTHAQQTGSLVVTGQNVPFKPPTLTPARKQPARIIGQR